MNGVSSRPINIRWICESSRPDPTFSNETTPTTNTSMKDESGIANLPQWVKEWLALGIFISVLLFLGATQLAFNDKDYWGAVGDLSGWASTLVSALGFVLLYYQLRQHHKDSKEAEDRHREVLNKQQELFEQNAKIALFDRRYKAHRAIYDFVGYACDNHDFQEQLERDFSFTALEVLYLFPESKPIANGLIAVNTIGADLLKVRSALSNTSDRKEKSIMENNATKLLADLIEAGKNLNNTLHEHLRMP